MHNFEDTGFIYKHLNGKKEKNDILFIFIHGYGSSPLDLLPLSEEINNNGYPCVLLRLKGHGGSGKDIIGVKYSDWKQKINESINTYKKSYSNIYLIGFSIGARLAIDLAKENNFINGVVGISTFIRPPKYTNILLKSLLYLSDLFNLKTIPRIVQSTKETSKNEIYYSKTLPTVETSILIKESKNLQYDTSEFQCKILLFHSTNDSVADYYAISKWAERNNNAKLITVRCLSHFLQFDIPQKNISAVIMETGYRVDSSGYKI